MIIQHVPQDYTVKIQPQAQEAMMHMQIYQRLEIVLPLPLLPRSSRVYPVLCKEKINLVLNLKIQQILCYSPLTLSNIIMCLVLLVSLSRK